MSHMGNPVAKPYQIMIVGEAWGEEEAKVGRPFVGASGRVLNGILAQSGIAREDCYLTNVFNLRPPGSNNIKNLCGSKAEGILGLPALSSGKYVLAQYAPELLRLYEEIRRVNPNLIIAAGATPAWALLLSSGIRRIRGATAATHQRVSAQLGRPFKVLPTYHPAAVMRDWTLRPIVLADFDKAHREMAFPEVIRPQREIWLEPTLADLTTFEHRFFSAYCEISLDIETKGHQITCIGFAPRHDLSLVVPFWDQSQADGNYWRTLEDELLAWRWVRRICEGPYRFVGQNFLYDIHFLWRTMGIRVFGAADDTMLMHHAQQPEMEKSLGFLGSVYTNEASWKFMRDEDTLKKED